MKENKLFILLVIFIITSCKTYRLSNRAKNTELITAEMLNRRFIDTNFKNYAGKDLCGYGHGNKQLDLPMEFNNDIEKRTWVIDSIFGLNDLIQSYVLTKIDTAKIKWSGNYLKFINKSTFESGYSSWCRNDYFTTVNGNYKILESNFIEFKVDSISYAGEWRKPTEYKKITQIFLLSKIGDTLVLTKYKKY